MQFLGKVGVPGFFKGNVFVKGGNGSVAFMKTATDGIIPVDDSVDFHAATFCPDGQVTVMRTGTDGTDSYSACEIV